MFRAPPFHTSSAGLLQLLHHPLAVCEIRAYSNMAYALPVTTPQQRVDDMDWNGAPALSLDIEFPFPTAIPIDGCRILTHRWLNLFGRKQLNDVPPAASSLLHQWSSAASLFRYKILLSNPSATIPL